MINAKLHISGVVRKGALPVADVCKRIDGRRAERGAFVCVVTRTSLRASLVEKNRSRSARMETSGRTAGPTRGWMGAHAPITTVFVPGIKSSGRMLRLSSSDPVVALAAIRPLVAAGGERVQRP